MLSGPSPGGPAPEVGIAVMDPIAAARCDAACRRMGGLPRRLEDASSLLGSRRHLDLLIYDALPFEGAIPVLVRIHREYPQLPIVLYPPIQAGVIRMALCAGGLPQVTGFGQWHGGNDVQQLAELMERKVALAPEREAFTVLKALCPHLSPRAGAFAGAALRARATGRRCTVETVSRAINVHPDRLRRRWPAQPFPSPKELLDWLTILYATHIREWSHVGWGAIARAMNIGENTLRRLRRNIVTDGDGSPGFAAVILTFAARSRIPETHAVGIVARTRGRRTTGERSRDYPPTLPLAVP